MTLSEVQVRRDEILALAGHYGAADVRIFGSVARGEARSDSDIDFLVSFQPGTSVWDAIGLWQDLGELLGHKISLLDDKSLDGHFRETV